MIERASEVTSCGFVHIAPSSAAQKSTKKGRGFIGHVKVDIEKGSRLYAIRYVLNDGAGVKALLRDQHRISSARFRGDMDASCILIDLKAARTLAFLTPTQAAVVALVYDEDMTHEGAAVLLGVARKNVGEALERATERIAAVYRRWEYGSVDVEYDEIDEDEMKEAA